MVIHRKTKLAAIPRDRFAWLRSQYIARPVIYLPSFVIFMSVLLARAEIFPIY